MSNGYKLELTGDGESETFLSFWDSLHGKDRHWLVLSNGSAYHIDSPDSTEIEAKPINLAVELRALLQELNSR